jgi:hypothetical protein
MSGANGQGKCRGLPPTAFPSSSRFSRSLFFYFMFQIALLRHGTASTVPKPALDGCGFSR